ncbi:MAG: hypothetical protein KDI51_17110, partial [Xanthomonadales bacterium]|nr:hypothetical protein [Xanthomonadales bacterium]
MTAATDWSATLHQSLQDLEASDAANERRRPDEISHYRYAQADLNDDEWTDAVVLIQQFGYCGTGGCTLLLLVGTEDGFEVVDRAPVVREPIALTEEWRSGWRTLVVGRGGGGVPSGLALMWFDGSQY